MTIKTIQLVEMEYGVCWNCQAVIPKEIEHHDKEEIVREIALKKFYNPNKAGLLMIVGGIAIGFIEQLRGYSLFSHGKIDYVAIFFGGFFALSGVAVIIIGHMNKKR